MEFVSFELAKKLKEKGFDGKCSHYYRAKCKDLYMIFPSEDWSNTEERINAPTISQVLKWFREKKRIHIGILYAYPTYSTWIQSIPGCNSEAQVVIHDFDDDVEASLEGIKYVIDNLI